MTGETSGRLQLLGRFGVTLHGSPPLPLAMPAGRPRALLAYLAMQPGHAEPRERLAALLWGDGPDKQARHSLRQCLMVLKRELEAVGWTVLRIERDRVALDPALVTVDAAEFAALAGVDDLAGLDRAAELYAGDLLDGFELDVATFDEWVRAERARLRASAEQVLERSVRQHRTLGHAAPAMRSAERLVALDPLRESAQRLLLRLLLEERGKDAALAQAEALRHLLRESLDAEPEPET